MSYATLSDLIGRAGEAELRQVADRDRNGEPDQDVIDAALQDAANTIDGYLGTRYRLPLTSVPSLVTTWAVSIARYLLHRDGAPEFIVQDYKDAISALKDAARGVISLPVATGQDAPVADQAGTVMAEHPPQVFTRARMRSW